MKIYRWVCIHQIFHLETKTIIITKNKICQIVLQGCPIGHLSYDTIAFLFRGHIPLKSMLKKNYRTVLQDHSLRHLSYKNAILQKLCSKLVICPTGQFHSTLALEKYVPGGYPVRQTKSCEQDISVEFNCFLPRNDYSTK